MQVAVYCGANCGTDPAFIDTSRELGRLLGENGHGLVYGAGSTGLMGIVAQAAHEAGARITGVIPQFLTSIEPPYTGIDELIVLDDMPTRRQVMIDRAQAFVVLPGGSGTLDEISEVIAYMKLGLIDAPCILVNTNGFYEGLRSQFDAMTKFGLMTEEARAHIVFAADAAEVIAALN